MDSDILISPPNAFEDYFVTCDIVSFHLSFLVSIISFQWFDLDAYVTFKK